ncbi:hypothetical protein BN8_03059 [Fibrisoma limi BUZ 3]|uniref:Porin n=1 Tax=Fibrisoma limi BUZ 3 TaxID=1185876 RepID=I2GJ50_9BACT|nr:putative porin [Fibrisoma limi]CCH53925.1 hypothetical protein BN8_03059 [Fibrisoma limi BUZ 3]
MNKYVLIVVCCLMIVGSAVGQQLPGGIRVPGGFPGSFGGQPSGPNSSTYSSPSGIDDSTKVIYGPRTTRYVLESDILNNRRRLYTTDTLLDGVDRYTYVQRSRYLFQDLGNLGTPIRPIFPSEPPQIGAQTGYYVFEPFQYQTMQVKYYDTKSPFTDMYLVLGGRNQNILRFDFAQNITPRWNVGFAVQRFTSQKQFGTRGSNDPNKLLAQNWGFLAHTNYRSKNKKYTLLLHFINMNHSIDEQGGVLPGLRIETGAERDTVEVPYDYTGNSRLVFANGRELRNDWHLYQQFVLDQGFQIYHRLDYKRQKNYYQDDTLRVNQEPRQGYPGFYPDILTDSSRIEQDNRFRAVDNQFGLKGVFRNFNYRAYARQRIYGQYGRYNINAARNNYGEYETRDNEFYVGGWLGYYFPDSLSRITAEAEYLIGGGFRLQGQFESKWLTGGYTAMLASPTLLQQRFQSNIFFWNNRFRLRGINHAYGTLNLPLGKLKLQPGLDYQLLSNYIYFNEQAVPQQASGAFSVLRVGLGYQYTARKFQALGQAYYSLVSRSDILRLPPLFVTARFQYEFLYAKVLYVQTGVELSYKSSYFADAYMPVTQQFYLQNRQQVEGYVVADVFANLRVNRTRLFVKLSHANQGLLRPGYYVAPDFLGMRRAFAFGVDWYLFD